MTTTSDSAGYIDYAAFGVSPDDLRSLKAMAPLWRDVLPKVASRFGADSALDEFVACTAELPLRIADVKWQSLWLHAWHKLSGRGFTMADMFAFFNHATACCEAELFVDLRQVSRVQLDLFGIFRRSVVAAISCAIELGEEAKTSEAGLPGEFAAIRCLRDLAAEGREVALLSVSIGNARVFSHLSAGELQNIPSLLTEQLTSLLRSQDRVFGGREGEWLLVLPDVQSFAQPVLAASHIRRAFADPVVLLSGRGLMLDVVIGAAMMPDHGNDAAEIIQSARLARSSLSGSDETFAMFDLALRQEWMRRYKLSEQLRIALRQEALLLFLQPQVDIDTGACFGAELLLRWKSEEGDWIQPPLIMEMIEENGWRSEFTDWLIRAALRISADLEAAGIPLSLSLNLTAGDLLDTDLPELVAQCLETWRLPGSRFTFELTESAMMSNRERGLAVMHKLRDMGIKLALDDFGTGFSSLSYLATLPLNEIKIDRSFVIAMSQSSQGLRIVRAIIDLTHDLGMHSLAEGVEDVRQRDQLLALGCRNAQGFLYGKPMPLNEFMIWYRTRQA